MSKRPSRPRRGLRRARSVCLTAFAACAVSAVAVSSAHAAPVPLQATFDDAKLSLPAPVGTTDILDPPPPATMTGTVDAATGAVNVPAANFVFPQFSGSVPPGIPLTVDFSAIDDITGTANPVTGDVTTNPSTYETVVTLGPPVSSTCTYDTDEAFTTGPGSPFNGDPFTVNLGNPVTVTNGIIQTSWGANHFPTDGPDCALLEAIINSGCGGLAMANGMEPLASDCAASGGGTTATTPPPSGNPAALKKCKKKAKKIKDKAKRKKAIKKCKKKFG